MAELSKIEYFAIGEAVGIFGTFQTWLGLAKLSIMANIRY